MVGISINILNNRSMYFFSVQIKMPQINGIKEINKNTPLNTRALYILKTKCIDGHFIVWNNTRTFAYLKSKYFKMRFFHVLEILST